MSTITVELKFELRDNTGGSKYMLDLIDPDGDRYCSCDTEAEAVQMVREMLDNSLGFTMEIDVDGRVQ